MIEIGHGKNLVQILMKLAPYLVVACPAGDSLWQTHNR